MKKILYIFFLMMFLLLSGCSTTQKQDSQLINDIIEISKYIKILDYYIEKAPGENTITSNSKMVVKYQNISNKVLTGVLIYVDYLDKENKPIGSILMIDEAEHFIAPSNIKVGRQELFLGSPKPEDIYGKEWNGDIKPEIRYIKVANLPQK